ncbi:pilus assembly protein PilM [Opitutales bacterium]|nr:pilus assembly protein PilM [Opitutales bacterium]
MAKIEETIFNLGSSHLSAWKVLRKEDKLFLDTFGYTDFPPTNGDEDAWISEVEVALSDLCREKSLKGEASFILPGNVLLSKTLRVPKVELDKQKKVVAFELSQKMPFPLENLLWDFLVIDDDGIEQEILSFAIKPEVVEKLIQVIFRCGIIPKLFTPGSALDYHAIQGVDTNEQLEDSLFINFGSRTTNLTFISSSGFLLRSLSFGGSQLTEALASAFGITYSKAEDLKLKDSTGEKAFNDEDPSFTTLQGTNENFLNKYMQEISRSIVTYKRLKKGRLPTSLIITGRAIRSKGIVETLSQTQQLRINYFDPYSQLEISPNIEKSSCNELPYIGSEALGLSKQLIYQNDRPVLNLMPKGKTQQLESKKKLPWMIALAFVVSFMPLPWYLNSVNQEMTLIQEIESVEEEIKHSNDELIVSKSRNQSLNLLQEINRSASVRFSKLYNLSNQTTNIQQFINHLQSVFDRNVNDNAWIDELKFNTIKPPVGNTIRNEGAQTEDINVVNIVGRYLVKLTAENTDLTFEERKDKLLENNGIRQESITNSFSEINGVRKIRKKVFSIEGKGDLYNRQFTHFEIELEIDL